jgi:UDP-N-acetylglucosamine acyltransferase
MARNGIPEESIKTIKKAHKIIYKKGLKLDEALKEIKNMHSEKNDTYLQTYIESIKDSKRGILR